MFNEVIQNFRQDAIKSFIIKDFRKFIAWNSLYAHPLPDGHRFPMLKYELIPEQLLHEGAISERNIFSPATLTEASVLTAHDRGYWQKLKDLSLTPSEQRATGFPLSKQLVDRETVIMQGTVDCAEYALTNGVALNVAGGTHHAFRDRGEGFCLLNDIALGAYHLLNSNKAKRILVVDLDVHQGNGTASIFSNDDRVFTFSMHGANNYPLRKEKSDLDIALPDHVDDAYYLKELEFHLNSILEKFEPDFIFYQCGVDILATDALGRFNISAEACMQRDRFVLSLCHRNSIPVCCVMGGGYSPDIKDIVNAHCNTFRIALDLFT